ncbi:MAG: c-type cytochrome biogenesis protein CcsB [Nitrospirae bacterium]|nr:c-type cytochrome biogenesis protein CcsB [Nitrospirota bacterium]MDA8340324.1 c-type cytochrome biogenesis protein CcsB [Nitrospiraceae bacterium]
MNDLSILKYEVVLHWIAVGFYILSTVFFAYSVSFQKERTIKPAMLFTLIGLLFHSIALGIRWLSTGHGPYLMKYEILSSNAWVVMVMFLIVAWRYPRLRPTGVVAVPLSFLMMTIGLFMNPEIKGLPPSLKGVWLVIHVTFNHLAVGALIIALGAAVLYLLKEKKGDTEFFKKLPPVDVLDAYSYKFAGFGFIFWSITIVAGAIWANQAWGRYWGWDPVETWSLITWLLYGLYLHSRLFLKWKGKKSAWMLVLCFILSILSIYFIPFMVKSLHSAYF